MPHGSRPLEQSGARPFGGETLGSNPEVAPELVQAIPERREIEALPPVVQAPAPILPIQPTAAAQQGDDATNSNPSVAGDDDLIEKEWIDKIKKVIESTKENPYRRELEIGKLQRDYIRKRYGRVIGALDDASETNG